MITYANGQNDFCSRMRRWEPVHFGPIMENSYNHEAWAQLEYSEPKFIKNNKFIKPCESKVATRVLKAAACALSKGKLNIKG